MYRDVLGGCCQWRQGGINAVAKSLGGPSPGDMCTAPGTMGRQNAAWGSTGEGWCSVWGVKHLLGEGSAGLGGEGTCWMWASHSL